MAANDNYQNEAHFISSIGRQIAHDCPKEIICPSLLMGHCPLIQSAVQKEALLRTAV